MARTVKRKMLKLDRSLYNKVSINIKNMMPDGSQGAVQRSAGPGGGVVGGTTVVQPGGFDPGMMQALMAQGATDNPIPLPKSEPPYQYSPPPAYPDTVYSDPSVMSVDPPPRKPPHQISIPTTPSFDWAEDNTGPETMSLAVPTPLPTPQPAGFGQAVIEAPRVAQPTTEEGIAAMEVDNIVKNAPGLSNREIRDDLASVMAPFAALLQQIENARSVEAQQNARERAAMFERLITAHAEQNRRVGKAVEAMLKNVRGTVQTSQLPALTPAVPPLSMGVAMPPTAPLALMPAPATPAPDPRGPYQWGAPPVPADEIVPVPSMRRRSTPIRTPLPSVEEAPPATEDGGFEEMKSGDTEPVPTPVPEVGGQMVPYAQPEAPRIQLAPEAQAFINGDAAPQFVSEDDPILARLIERTQGAKSVAIVRRDAPKADTEKTIRRLKIVLRAAEASQDDEVLGRAQRFINGLEDGSIQAGNIQTDVNRMFRNIKRADQRTAAKSYKSQEVLRERRYANGKQIRAKKIRSKILVEADVNYVTSGGVTLGSSGCTFTVSTKRNAGTYVAATMSTYGPSSYGGYTSLCIASMIPVTGNLWDRSSHWSELYRSRFGY
ncbi:hypothetical protein JKP88DRAFT_242190 [Tribonema minus]|uniref:Uncharacterized protein n=1 Tax=Tribonema minus TaxID=303371 RepID=A0A836CA46_9STRA|nr:hypothetical protein JKP88DRAFT_242190 [Tribonema minus]